MSASSETTPLLPTQNGNGNPHSPSFNHRVVTFFKAEGQPSWLSSYRFFFFGSWLNVLLVFIPLSFLAEHLQWDAAFRFGFSFVAIMPLAALLGTATDQMSLKLGQTLSGLLNASFGNAVEIIVGVAALLQNELRIVQTSMLGSILSNLLLVLGCSFFAGGLKYTESSFDETAAQASSSLMTLACITLVIPAAYHSAQSHSGNTTALANSIANAVVDGTDLDSVSERGLLLISRGTALLLLVVYIGYLLFQLKTHAHLFADEENEEVEEQKMNIPAAASALLLVTVMTSFCADYLVASIEEVATRYGISKPFIGVILLPIVANAAEHVTSVWMARKNKMALTIGICVGSSIQISALVVPLLVIIGWITGHNLTLFFSNFETIVLFVSVLLVQFLIQDGKSNYMEGMMLMTLYLVIAISFWVSN
ncbi:calcium/proton exchanger [Rhodofomes roseus]|uniref:Vacuolar calcium ion transporter n=1 Tax=Rhodofomes roseus TaxID=34475 RepID=A0ABQ8K6V2_9APHY|nr:calcium/proton exchanger [Rhodofomes roseus]KAH9832977.1 calcium/proton exchanger [Rhodofomes roseus]